MRVRNWPARLAEVLVEWRGREFRWGVTDCCQFVGAVGLAITGEDRREIFGAYDSEVGAADLLALHGGMQGLLIHAFGAPIPAALVPRGGIVLCEFGCGLQPAVVYGAECWAPAVKGMVRRRVFRDALYPDPVIGWSIL